MSFDADTAACAGLVHKGDPDRFAAAMALPVPVRARLFPLWAFNLEVARAPWVTSEPLIARMRLQWWRDALEEIAEGRPVRRHEVTTPLAAVITPDQARLLDTLVVAREADTETTPFPDEAALHAYLDATSGTLLAVAAQVLGAAPDAAEALRPQACAIGMANWLRALPELEARGRQPMPDGRPETLARLAKSALANLDRAGRRASPVRQALLCGWQARDMLSRAARRPADVARGALAPVPLRRSFTLVRARITGRI